MINKNNCYCEVCEKFRARYGQGSEPLPHKNGQYLSRPIIHPLQQAPTNAALIKDLTDTIAQQAQMIEHLRGGPTPLYTAVGMANAARDERRGIAENLIERLAVAYPDSEAMMTVECFADWLSKEMKS